MKTEGLDKTIELLNGMLESAKDTKEKLQITDRLLRCYSLQLKHADDGKGGKFAELESPTQT